MNHVLFFFLSLSSSLKSQYVLIFLTAGPAGTLPKVGVPGMA
jgi:hypothetical protein